MALPTLLLTRPEASARAFAATLDPKSLSAVQVVIAPLMEIAGTGVVPDLEHSAGVIFTSAGGVAHAPDGMGRPAYCVGAATTERARERGWTAHLAGSCARELIETLRTTRPSAPLVHLGGEHTVGDIAQSLSTSGITTTHVALYHQTLLPLSLAGRNALSTPTIIPVFSPRTAQQMVNEATGNFGNAHIIALSDSVAAPFAGENTRHCLILPSPQVIYMRKAVENLCLTLSLP